MKLCHQRRPHRPHDLRVETVNEHDHGTQRRNEELITAKRLLVDEFTHVEYGCLFHGGGKYNMAEDAAKAADARYDGGLRRALL